MEKFTRLLNKFIETSKNNKYFLAVHKPCGYEFLVIINQKITLCELYRRVSLELENFDHIKLYLRTEDIGTPHKMIPKSQTILKTYLSELTDQGIMQPFIEMPAPVVYQIWVDDRKNQ